MKKALAAAFTIIVLVSILYFFKNQERQYVFVKDYTATVTVGGFVGIREKTFQVGEVIKGNEVPNGVKTRIAPFSVVNLGKPSSASYDEFIVIPMEYLK